jgi:iron complex transport system ATP-binding protein
VTTPIVEIAHATVYRGETLALRDLSLVVSEGEHTAVVGPNGSGKSTLLKLLSQELYPLEREGTSIHLFGKDRWNVWDLRRHLGVVSHDLQHQYLGHARGLDVILSGYHASIGVYDHQTFKPEQKARAHRLMERLAVTPLKDRMFDHMSTGEQRRFLLGRALVHDPGALLLDEPTSGLDLKACFEYLAIIRGLMAEGKTIVLVTHHLHEIPPEIARIVLLKAGVIVADGPKQDLFTSTQLTTVFDMPVNVVQSNGWYQALPGRRSITDDL